MNIMLTDFWNVVNSSGGAEKVLCRMANELVDRGHEVTVVCSDPKSGNPFFYLSDKVNFVNLNGKGCFEKGSFYLRIQREFFRILGTLDKDKMYIKTRFGRRIKKDFSKLIENINPDVIITFDPKSLLVLKCLLKNTLPTIAMLHMEAVHFFSKNRISPSLLKAYRSVDCIQVLSRKDIEIVKEFCGNIEVVYIPNTVDMPDKIIKTKNCNKIINIGRIDGDHKRQLFLINAFNKIKEYFPQWQLEIWGGTYTEKQNQYKNEIIDYIGENKLEEKVFLMGETKDIINKLMDGDIFAFPSKSEGMPLALMDAMSVGLPAIGYKSCASVNELIIDNFNGFLCDDGIDDFADKLKLLMSDADLRRKLGGNARESMKAFAPGKIWDEWEALINNVIRIGSGK